MAISDPMPSQRQPLANDMRGSLPALAAWVLGIVTLGTGVGMLFVPDAWFFGLHKPTWNPPDWLFAPVWATLYVLMGISFWLVRSQIDAGVEARRRASVLFLVQLLLNLMWTPIFFGLRSPLLAFIEICALWCAVLFTTVEFGKIRALAGYLFLPYFLWVSFALVLNGTIWLMNI
jgi:translocator protein